MLNVLLHHEKTAIRILAKYVCAVVLQLQPVHDFHKCLHCDLTPFSFHSAFREFYTAFFVRFRSNETQVRIEGNVEILLKVLAKTI